MPSDADHLAQLVSAARASESKQLDVTNNGRELVSLDGRGEALATMSVTKLLVGTILGRAVRLRLLGLDQPVHRWFPEWATGAKAAITVRHVMGHVSGLAADTWPQLDASPPPDMLTYVLHELPMVEPPGKVWAYNNAAVMLLPAIVSRAASVPFLDFARTEFFEPLEIDEWNWRCDDAGNPFGMATAALNAANLSKIGRLLAQNGRWHETQLFDPDWVAVCRRPPITGVRAPGLLLFHRWANDERTGEPVAFGHDGSGGQHLWVYPASGLVIARLRDNRLPNGRGFDPGTPEQRFPNLIKLGADLDMALRTEQ